MRWIGNESFIQQLENWAMVANLLSQTLNPPKSNFSQGLIQIGQSHKGSAKRGKIARTSKAGGGAACQALQVGKPLQAIPQTPSGQGLPNESPNRIEPGFYVCLVKKRLLDPAEIHQHRRGRQREADPDEAPAVGREDARGVKQSSRPRRGRSGWGP